MKSYFDMTDLEKLKELRSTLQEAASAEGAQLDMGEWVTEMPTEHFCNSACCIMGYQAIKEVMKSSSQEPQLTAVSHIASDLAEHTSLLSSIWLGSSDSRWRKAKATGLFSRRELNSLNHLNTNFPSFNDAIEYINACIAKMEPSNENT